MEAPDAPALLGAARLRRPRPNRDPAMPIRSASPCSTLCSSACAASRRRWRTQPIPCSAGSRRWRRRCGATCTRCAPSCASARSRLWRAALRRLVRARASYRPRQCRLLRPPLRLDALVDPDAGALDPLGRRRRFRRPRRGEGRRAGRRSGRGGVEDLLCLDLQSGAGEDRRDAEGDAAANIGKTCPKPRWCRSWSRARRRGRARWSRHRRRRSATMRRRAGRRCAPRRCTAPAATSTNARTQTVFGEGPLDARILFVGEQPGDQEDLAGRPFVGPAGQLFDRALAEAGIDRTRTYVTNAVKHFKFVPPRQAPDPRQARRRRDRRLPLVAAAGAGADPPAAHRRARRDRGALPVRQGR